MKNCRYAKAVYLIQGKRRLFTILSLESNNVVITSKHSKSRDNPIRCAFQKNHFTTLCNPILLGDFSKYTGSDNFQTSILKWENIFRDKIDSSFLAALFWTHWNSLLCTFTQFEKSMCAEYIFGIKIFYSWTAWQKTKQNSILPQGWSRTLPITDSLFIRYELRDLSGRYVNCTVKIYVF